MARKKKTKVFVSYSRHDEALVRPLAGLLGVAAEDAVFLDVEQLRPGDVWEEKLVGAVREASVFVLCWCCESRRSEFVAKEIGLALEDGRKRLVPVLFCEAKLPEALRSRQWIDLRGKVVHVCSCGEEVLKGRASTCDAVEIPLAEMQVPPGFVVGNLRVPTVRERFEKSRMLTEQRSQASRSAAWNHGSIKAASKWFRVAFGADTRAADTEVIAARARRYFEGLGRG